MQEKIDWKKALAYFTSAFGKDEEKVFFPLGLQNGFQCRDDLPCSPAHRLGWLQPGILKFQLGISRLWLVTARYLKALVDFS